MNENCTVFRATGLIGQKWTPTILLELHKGKNESKRYSDLKKSIPTITAKMLSERLKELENEGLIKKKVDAKTSPIRCDYSITKNGKELIKIIKKIKEWSLEHQHKNSHCDRTNCKDCPF